MASNGTFTNSEQQYGTHWHLRIMGINDSMLVELQAELQHQVDVGYLTYVSAGVEVGNLNNEVEVQHVHVALGTKTSTKKWPIVNKLGLLEEERKAKYTNWYLVPVYKTSSPCRNRQYCLKGAEACYYELGDYIEFFNINKVLPLPKDNSIIDLTV